MSSNSNNMVMQQNDTARELVWETLYMYNMLDGKLYPLIADGDYTWNDTQTELTVKIKSDAKFNDGSQLKALYSDRTTMKKARHSPMVSRR